MRLMRCPLLGAAAVQGGSLTPLSAAGQPQGQAAAVQGPAAALWQEAGGDRGRLADMLSS